MGDWPLDNEVPEADDVIFRKSLQASIDDFSEDPSYEPTAAWLLDHIETGVRRIAEDDYANDSLIPPFLFIHLGNKKMVAINVGVFFSSQEGKAVFAQILPQLIETVIQEHEGQSVLHIAFSSEATVIVIGKEEKPEKIDVVLLTVLDKEGELHTRQITREGDQLLDDAVDLDSTQIEGLIEDAMRRAFNDGSE